MKIEGKKTIIKYCLICINILMFIVISYINIRTYYIYYDFFQMHDLPVITYNHTYVTLYYVLFVVCIVLKNSRIKENKAKKVIYIVLLSIGFLFGVFSIYKYHKISQFLNIFSFSSASIVIISQVYNYLNKEIIENETTK